MRITVFGYGPVGRATVSRLVERGDDVVVAQRHRPADLADARLIACDLRDRDAVVAAARGADQIVLAAGFPYERKIWKLAWPLAVSNVIHAARVVGSRIVFVDNLYMYGPQTSPLHEGMALTDFGHKPRTRAEVTRLWQNAPDVPFAALRAPDFYGPGVRQSMRGVQVFGNLAKGKAAVFLYSPDIPHDFAYVPDIARAVTTLVDAPDDAYGQAWHMPSAPLTTPRRIVEIGAAAIGARPRTTTLPRGAVPLMGLFSPFMAEMSEMKFQWDRPYIVDASKFRERFWSDVTPFDTGAAETARSFSPERSAL